MACIFCDIINKKIPAKIIYQDEKIIAFDDIHPRAPVHKLIVPRKHIATLNDFTDEDKDLISDLIFVAKNLAAQFNIAASGYRLVANCNADGGQIVYHFHLHLLGGRKMHSAPCEDKCLN